MPPPHLNNNNLGLSTYIFMYIGNSCCKKTRCTLLHIMPFCERPNKKPEGFAKQKQPAIFAMRHASQLVQHHPSLIYNVPYFIAALLRHIP